MTDNNLGIIICITTFLFASGGSASTNGDRLRDLIIDASRTSQIPVHLNQQVYQMVKKYVDTEGGRSTIRGAMARMEPYYGMLESKAREYDLPIELLAIPVVESEYRNIKPSASPTWGAGIWMFIQGTAKRFGLRVGPRVDERLNIQFQSDAAMQYFKYMYERFQSWPLAILAYNAGDGKISNGISSLRSRDPWRLIHNGYYNDPNYLAKVMAVIVVMKNPELLR